MIPILYDKNETDFTHNGIGFLSNTIKATVTEERNGSYELSLRYPLTGAWYDQITRGSIIKAKANDTSAPQLFRVYKASRPLNGIVTYSAEHISYALNGIPTCGLSVKNVTPQIAINKTLEGAALPCKFTALSDISTLNSTEIKEPCSVRAILGGQRGSILDVWGGEYEFDNFVVRLHAHRGTDNGVTIEYGKNLTDITQEENISECYTHLMPYAAISQNGYDGDVTYVYLSERVLPLIEAEDIGHSKAYIMDFTDRFGDNEEITEKALREKAKAYISTADLGVPKVSISVSFVPLWQTEEYKNIAPLERVSLCDTVRVYFSKLGVTATAKVNKTVYDVLNERYDGICIGDAKSSFADTVNKTNSEIADVRESVKTEQAKAAEVFQKEIERATNAITGYSGGYIRLNPPENPQELLILDKPEIEKALNLWRFNINGFGHSSNGYNGTYRNAFTMDGHFNADFITVGTLTGIDIRGVHIYGTNIEGGSIKGSTIEIGTGFSVDINGKMKATGAEITGKVTATSGTIGNFNIDNGDNTAYFPRGALYCDYDGEARHFRTIIKAAHFDEKVNTAAFTWTLSTQTYSTAENEKTYRPTFILYADGIAEHYRNIYLADGAGLRIGKRQTSNTVADTSINLLTPDEKGNVLLGAGSQAGDTQLLCSMNNAIACCLGNTDRAVTFTFETSTYVGISASRYVMRGKGGALVITANNGNNALYLQGSEIYAVGSLRTTGNFTADGTINSVTIALENIGFSGAGISAANRRVIRTATALVISANSGSNAMYLDASTTYIIGNLTISGTAKFSSGSAITSDARLKNNIAPLADDKRYEKLYKSLKPVTHKYNDGQSGRTHIGFVAQDLKQALLDAGFTTDEIAAYVEFASDKEGLDGYECAIRYNEFIPLNTAMIQKCFALIAELWQKVNS